MVRFLRAVTEAISVIDALCALVRRLSWLTWSLAGLAVAVSFLLVTLGVPR